MGISRSVFDLSELLEMISNYELMQISSTTGCDARVGESPKTFNYAE
jgi:hypothetical protein